MAERVFILETVITNCNLDSKVYGLYARDTVPCGNTRESKQITGTLRKVDKERDVYVRVRVSLD